MKKRLLLLLILSLVFVTCASGCGQKSLLNPDNPVALTLWHVYGEQADSPMNRLIDEFNSSVGKEKGIVITTTLMSNALQIGQKLLDAQAEKPGALDMPDMFFCHNSNAEELGVDNLIDWETCFSKDEMGAFVSDFLPDGMVDDTLVVLPVTKSTQLLFLNGTEFARFSKATGITTDDLETWDGFFEAAAKYYDWSSGKPFCAFDYLLRSVELNAISSGIAAESLYKDGWYDFSNNALKTSWLQFANALVQGHIVISDLYSNTQVMTGEVAGGMGSSASILYYNDTVTYPDNTTEPMDLQILPMPHAAGGKMLASQAGVGLCALKTTAQKQEAISVFAHWLTDSDRNLAFAAQTGYMPVTYDAFDAIKDYDFNNAAFASLYQTFTQVQQSARILSEPSFAGFYGKTRSLYEALRAKQKDYAKRSAGGADTEQLSEQTWKLFKGIS